MGTGKDAPITKIVKLGKVIYNTMAKYWLRNNIEEQTASDQDNNLADFCTYFWFCDGVFKGLISPKNPNIFH